MNQIDSHYYDSLKYDFTYSYMHIADRINQKNFQEFSLANYENNEKHFWIKISNKKSAS